MHNSTNKKSPSKSRSRLISRDYVLYLRSFAHSRGVTAKTLIDNTDADLKWLLEPPKQVNEDTYNHISFNLFNSLKNPYKAAIEFGKGMLLSSHGPLGIAIQGAKNLYEVANLTQKFYQTRASVRHLTLLEAGEYFCIRLSNEPIKRENFMPLVTLVSFEYIIANLLSDHRLEQQCILHQKNPLPKDFPWQEVKNYQLVFDQQYDQLLVPLDWMDLTIKTIDPELADYAKSQCEQSLEELVPSDLVNEIKSKLNTTRNYHISLVEMATELHISPSTLQRRLREFNTTFKQIKLEQRLEHAKQMLRKSNITLEQISEQLGFCDASSFTKSFKTVTGCTPSIYRAEKSLTIS